MTTPADAQFSHVVCRSYTHARRFPLVIGNIQGLRLRVPWTPTQLAVAVGAFLVLINTRHLWAHLSPVANALVLAGVPVGLAVAARAVRVEGRAPWRFALGWLTGWLARQRPARRCQVVRMRSRVAVTVEHPSC